MVCIWLPGLIGCPSLSWPGQASPPFLVHGPRRNYMPKLTIRLGPPRSQDERHGHARKGKLFEPPQNIGKHRLKPKAQKVDLLWTRKKVQRCAHQETAQVRTSQNELSPAAPNQKYTSGVLPRRVLDFELEGSQSGAKRNTSCFRNTPVKGRGACSDGAALRRVGSKLPLKRAKRARQIQVA